VVRTSGVGGARGNEGREVVAHVNLNRGTGTVPTRAMGEGDPGPAEGRTATRAAGEVRVVRGRILGAFVFRRRQ